MADRDYWQLKIDFFQSSHTTVEEFFRSLWETDDPNRRKHTAGRSKEKKDFKARMLENIKMAEEHEMKKKTLKFYTNMWNVMMSHAQSLVEYKEIVDQSGAKHKVPIFKDIKEAKEAIKEVRTFNWDVNSYRDLGIRNSEDGGKIANVQFVFSDEEDPEWEE